MQAPRSITANVIAAVPPAPAQQASELAEVARWRVEQCASSPRAHALLKAMQAGAWVEPAHCVKREPSSTTILGVLALDDATLERVVLKVCKAPGWRPITGPILYRQWVGAHRLARVGVAVSAPIALLQRDRPSTTRGNQPQALLLEQLVGEDLIHFLAREQLASPTRRAAARSAGALVRHLAGAGLFFRDAKLSNIILQETGELGLIDTADVRRFLPIAPLRRRARERMLLAMLKEAAGASLLPSRADRMRCLRSAMRPQAPRARVHAQWRRLESALSRAGDTTPRVDPRAKSV